MIHTAISVSLSLKTIRSPSAYVIVYSSKVHLRWVVFPHKQYIMEPQTVTGFWYGVLNHSSVGSPSNISLHLATSTALQLLFSEISQCALLLKFMYQSQLDFSFTPTFGSCVSSPRFSLSISRLWNPEFELTLTCATHSRFKFQWDEELIKDAAQPEPYNIDLDRAKE